MRKLLIKRAFLIVMGFFIFIFAIFSVSKTGYSYNNSTIKDIDSINKKIAELEEMKKGYEAAAIKHSNQADRLQFIDGQLQLAKKHWKLADSYKEIAKKIQDEINDLEQQKVKIQKNDEKPKKVTFETV